MSATTTNSSLGRRLGHGLLAVWAVALAALVLAASPALAADGFGIVPGSFTATTASTQAGAHADATTSFTFNTGTDGYPVGAVKDIVVDLPQGVVGNPESFPKCNAGQLVTQPVPACPVDSQLGDVHLHFVQQGFAFEAIFPVYNMEARGTRPAEFGFNVILASVFVSISVRPDDQGLRATIHNVPTTLRLVDSTMTLWGDPADPSHDEHRGSTQCSIFGGVPYCSSPPTPAGFPPAAFMRNPTECGKPGAATLKVTSWEHPDDVVTVVSDPTTMVGCDRLKFDADLSLQPSSGSAGAPTGATVDLTVPQSENPKDLGAADLRKAVVKLPAGMSVNPAAADGLQGCSTAQIDLEGSDDPTCPSASKIGTVQIDTPLLGEPMTGAVYLAQPHANRFDSLLALYLVAKGSGVTIKLPGRIEADATTGQLTATFDNNPQLPFTRLRMQLNAGSRAQLALPNACGTYETQAELTSWGGQVARSTSRMTVDQNCDAAARFAPSFSAGVTNPAGGKSSPFSLAVARADGEQELQSITSVQLPAGLLANVGSVPQCGEADAATGTCPAASRVGRVEVAAGSGSPVWLPQAGKVPTSVSLTGPYKGAPFGLSIVVPAQAGPFDLGLVVVRAGVYIDRTTAAVTVKSDPLPLILSGIPLRLRQVNVLIDRPGFMRNPTNCNPMSITAAIDSVGSTATPSVRFQAGGCRDLDFTPKLAMTLSGKGQTTDGKHPGLTAKLTQPDGQANNKKVSVSLPLSLALDPDNANGLCEPVDAAADKCPALSIVGHAHAISPILDQPLDGPVYFVRGERKDPKSGRIIRTLPKLYVPLTGENGIKIDLHAGSEVKAGHLVTTFDNIPDAPVSSFEMSIIGGKGGILTVSDADICKSTQVANQQVDGQSGKDADAPVSIQTPSCPLKVVSKKIGRTSVAVRVSGIGAGKVTITGKGIKKTTKTISKATVATITAKRTKGKPGKVKVSFLPTGAKKARTVVTS
ncbi:MAG TPA: hypothetical protein VFY45_02260 [Baekduia sp.]|nr:hypothetical protein [Baekduia sp.]